MKKFINSIAIIVFVFSLSINLVGAQTMSSDSISRILNALLKANLIPAQNLQTAKSMLGSYSAYDDTYCYSFNRDLTVGATGEDVSMLQNFLQSKGYLGSLQGDEGYFGAMTSAALASYQAANGISPANGYFGPMTRGLIVRGCTSEVATSTETKLITNIISEDVETERSDDSKTSNIKFNYVLDLTAVNGDVYVPITMKWSLPDISENINDGMILALERNDSIISPQQGASINWGLYGNDYEYIEPYYVLREGNTVRVQFSAETGDLSESGTYRVSLVGFVYRDSIDGGIQKQHIIKPGIISTRYVKVYPEIDNSISVELPTTGSIYDNGPNQTIISGWKGYQGAFDYYRVTLTSPKLGKDIVLEKKVNKKSNGYATNSGKISKLMLKNWKSIDYPGYFKIEAIKKTKGKEKVVASGMSGMFMIKEQNKPSNQISVNVVQKGETFVDGKRFDMQDIILSSSNRKATGWNIVFTCPSNIGEISIKGGVSCGEDYIISGYSNTITIPVGFERLDISSAYVNLKIESYEGTIGKDGFFIRGKKVGETTYDLGLYAG